MPVTYLVNGAQMTLDPVQQLGYEQVPVWDGPTYLYTIHRLHFRGTYNPATFSWDLGTGPGGTLAPFPVAGRLPPTSNNATRHFLMQSRGTFVYTIGGIVPVLGGPVVGGIEALRAPTNVLGSNVNPNGTTNGGATPTTSAYQTDADNGPRPLHCHVVEVKGTKTFLVDWAIECYVNECYLFKTSQSLSALLSQRWTYEEDLDQDFFATRTIKGHAIFRSDRLLALSAVPDDYRAWLVHPVLPNFRRTVQQMIPSEDGTRIDYVLVDRESAFNFVPSVVSTGVTRIEATYSHGYSRNTGTEETAFRAGFLALELAVLPLLPSANDPFIGARAALRTLPRAVDVLIDTVPRFNQEMDVRVWGNRTATRQALYNTAVNIFLSKIGNEPLRLGSGSVIVTEDLMGKFVQLVGHVKSGPIRGAQVSGRVGLAIPKVGPDDIPGVTQSAYNTPLQTSPPLAPLDFGTRSNIYSAIANTLAGSCGLTPEPSVATERAYQDRLP